VNISAISLAGLNQAQAGFEKAAGKLTSATGAEDSVDLSGAAVGIIQAKDSFEAQIVVLKADEMETSTLSLLA
jgi:hypothetical protein